MKKIISLLLVTLLLFAACPTFAADATYVSIVSVENNSVYTVGASVPLMAETNEAAIKNIDFYANGIKIPGTVTDAGKAVVWTPAVAGSYALTAKVTSTAGGETLTAAAVNVTVKSNADEVIVKDFNSDASFNTVSSDAAGNKIVGTNAKNTEYAKKSSSSLSWTPSGSKYLYFKDLDASIYNSSTDYYTHLNYLVYATHPITVRSYIKDNTLGYTRPTSTGGWLSFNQGWNVYSIEIQKLDHDGYYAVDSRIATIHEINFTVDNNSETIPTGYGFVNQGEVLGQQTNLSDATLYFDSVWMSKGAYATAIGTPSIPDGKTDVCNQLDKYTITFDKAMDVNTLNVSDGVELSDIVTITGSDADAIVPTFTCTGSSNALVLDFEGDFAYNKTYTVTLNNKVTDAYGISVGDNASWSFTTVESCNSADPIPALVYPKSGATVTEGNVVLATKIIFDGSVSSVVYRKSDGSEIGTAVEGSDNEWYCVADLAAAEYTGVYATITYNNGESTKDTGAVSFTVAEAASYSLTGIAASEEIALNTTVAPVLSRTIGLSSTDGVSKVIYKVDGVAKATVTSAPFSWEMPITDINTSHTVSASVYTAAGAVDAAGVSYKAVYVTASTVRGENDFETDTSTGLENLIARTDDTFKIANGASLGREGNVLSFTRAAAHANPSRLYTKYSYTATKTVASFDIYLPSGAARTSSDKIAVSSDQIAVANAMNIIDLSTLPTDQWLTISVLIDVPAKKITYCVGNDNYVVDMAENLITALTPTASVTYPKAFVDIESYNNYYLDNYYEAVVVADTTRADSFVNGFSYDADSDSVNTTVSIANLTGSPVDATVFFALYDGDTLVKAWAEPVTVAAKEFKQVNKDVAYSQDGKTGTTVKAFCWTNQTDLQPVTSIR